MQLSVHAQIDPEKLDSLSRSINSSAKVHKAWQDSFAKVQDSIYHAAISKKIENNYSNSDQFTAEQKRKLANQRQQLILSIVIGAVLLIVGSIILILRRKTKT